MCMLQRKSDNTLATANVGSIFRRVILFYVYGFWGVLKKALWTDGWTDRWMDGPMDGWIDRPTYGDAMPHLIIKVYDFSLF